MNTEKKLCLFCKHFRIWGGFSGASEQTPPEDPEAKCSLPDLVELQKGKFVPKWELKEMDMASDFRAYLKTAETCPDYEEDMN